MVKVGGMQSQTLGGLRLQVSQILVQNIRLGVASSSQTVEVNSETPVIDSGSMTVGQVINERTVQEIPLNGRHFVDLGLKPRSHNAPEMTAPEGSLTVPRIVAVD